MEGTDINTTVHDSYGHFSPIYEQNQVKDEYEDFYQLAENPYFHQYH